MRFQDLPDEERVALAVALEKQVRMIADDEKAAIKSKLECIERDTGADRLPIRVNGKPVGCVSMGGGRPKPVITNDRWQECMDYLAEKKLVEWKPVKGWEEHFGITDIGVMDLDTGEIAECFDARYTPRTARVTGCAPTNVAEAFGQLPDGIKGILEA